MNNTVNTDHKPAWSTPLPQRFLASHMGKGVLTLIAPKASATHPNEGLNTHPRFVCELTRGDRGIHVRTIA